MSRLNDRDRQRLRRIEMMEGAEARYDGRCGVRIALCCDEDVAVATTAMAQSLSDAERAEAARRIAALWNLMRHIPTEKLERLARAAEERGGTP